MGEAIRDDDTIKTSSSTPGMMAATDNSADIIHAEFISVDRTIHDAAGAVDARKTMLPQSNTQEINLLTSHIVEQNSQQIERELDQSGHPSPQLTKPMSNYDMIRCASLVIDEPPCSDTNLCEQRQTSWQLTVPDLPDLPHTRQSAITCYYKDCFLHLQGAKPPRIIQSSLSDIQSRVFSLSQCQSQNESNNALDALAELSITTTSLETYLQNNERLEELALGTPITSMRKFQFIFGWADQLSRRVLLTAYYDPVDSSYATLEKILFIIFKYHEMLDKCAVLCPILEFLALLFFRSTRRCEPITQDLETALKKCPGRVVQCQNRIHPRAISMTFCLDKLSILFRPFKNKNIANMCQIHTETMFARCAHTAFTHTINDDCSCNRDYLLMEVSMSKFCPYCRHNPKKHVLGDQGVEVFQLKRGHKTMKCLLTRVQIADLADWARRLEDFIDAQVVIRAELDRQDHESNDNQEDAQALPSSRGELREVKWLDGAVPLDFKPDNFLVDQCDFITPKITVVPPRTLPPWREECDICKGLFDAPSRIEACPSGARMLPCGHIICRNCLVRCLKISNLCPFCRREFSILPKWCTTRESYYQASIDRLLESCAGQRGFVGKLKLPLMLCIFPFVLAVAITMNVAPKVNVLTESDHQFRTAPQWKRILFAIGIIAFSPSIYLVMIYGVIFGRPAWLAGEDLAPVAAED